MATLHLPKFNIYLVACYAPASSAADLAEYEAYLEDVEEVVKRIPKGPTPILLGDMNAKISRDAGNESLVGIHTTGMMNDRGEALVEMLTRLRMRAWNTFFRRRSSRLWTWRSPNGITKNQIDFVCAPPSVSVKNCGVINRFQFDSDHRLVRFEMRVKTERRGQAHRPRPPRPSLNRSIYRNDALALSTVPLPLPQDSSDAYNIMRAFVETAAVNSWETPIDPPHITPPTQLLLAQRLRYRNDPTPRGRMEYVTSCKAARIALLEDIRKRRIWLSERAVINGTSLRRASRKGAITRTRLLAHSHAGYSQQATANRVQSFYTDLFTPTVPLTPHIPLPTEPFIPFGADEATLALASLRLGRSPGPDSIASEQLYLARETLAPTLAFLLNSLVNGDAIPSQLVQANITLLFKKGDPTDIGNFRPIALVSGVLKAMTRAVLTRMERNLEESESPTQAGFRRGYSTLDNIHIMKQIAEKSKEFGFPIYAALVDFKKAFDSVEWSAAWTALTYAGVHPSLTKLLSRLYDSSTTNVLVNSQPIPVEIKRGIKQGDTLSPKIFTATLNMAIRNIDWQNMGLKMEGSPLPTLEYADDVVVLARTRPELEKMLKCLKDATVSVGLSINSTKTVLLSSCTTTRAPITIDGEEFRFRDHAPYLGARLSFPLDQKEELRQRLQGGWLAFSRLQDLLCSRNTPLHVKKRLFDSCVTPAVLYGAECWTLKASDRERLAITQRKMERRMLGLTWADHWTNERMRALTKLTDWKKEADKKKLLWANRLRRMPQGRHAKAATYWIPYSHVNNRPPGRPPRRWRDDLTELVGRDWLSIPDDQYRTRMARHVD